MSLIQFLHIIFCISSMYLSIFAKMIWWLLSRGLDFKIQMIPNTFLLLNFNGNNTFNRRRPKSQIFCCPHFVMISLLGIGQKSSHVCFSADFSTQTRMAWGQILTWFWRFTVGDEQGGDMGQLDYKGKDVKCGMSTKIYAFLRSTLFCLVLSCTAHVPPFMRPGPPH